MIRRKLYVATPAVDAQATGASRDSLMLLATQPRDFDLQYDFAQDEHSVVHARARHIRKFLESDATDLLFSDADVAYHPEVVRGMVRTNLPILLTPYPRKRIDWDRIEAHVCGAIADAHRRGPNERLEVELGDLEAHGQSYPIHFKRGGLSLDGCTGSILGAGIGCSLWSRVALEETVRAAGGVDGPLGYHDGPRDTDPLTCAVTLMTVHDQALPSEDLTLCNRARDAGFDVRLYLGPYAPASHVGPYFFPGKLEAFGVRS